jgi:hypothetical protein
LDVKKKKATDIVSTYKDNRKNDVDGVFYALDAHWKQQGRSRGAFHGGTWDDKVSCDGMRDPGK